MWHENEHSDTKNRQLQVWESGDGMRILIAEDDVDLNDIIVTRLKEENYGVDACFDGEEARDYIEQTDYDAVILDIMMPKMDGITLLRTIRREGNKVPVLFLTAKDTVADRVNGLDAGANDYLVKPFAFEELLARIRVMTRKKADSPTDVFTLEDLTVDCVTHCVKRSGKEIKLSGKEFAILEYMIRNAGIVLSKESIEQHIWSYDFEGDENIIKVYIRYLRKKIDDDFEVKLIHTIRNYGYVLKKDEGA